MLAIRKINVRALEPSFQGSKNIQPSVKQSPATDIVSFQANKTRDSEALKKDIIEQEQYARSLGVKAKYGDNLYLAKLVNEALTDLKNAGYKLPKKVIYGYPKLLNKNPSPEDVAMNSGWTIYLNDRFDWKNHKDKAKRQFDNGWISADDPKHTVYHEAGHYLHRLGSVKSFLSFMKLSCAGENFTEEASQWAKENVSKYASTDLFDFVAEVFAGSMAGKKYPEDVIEFYNELKGPSLKNNK